jgi:Tc5 transposase DNA-binding domain.
MRCFLSTYWWKKMISPTFGSLRKQKAEGKPMTQPMIIDKAMSFYNEMKITDKCTFSEG